MLVATLVFSVPALFTGAPSDTNVPELEMNAPALLLTAFALSVKPAATLMPEALVELFVSVVMPVKLPAVTFNAAVLPLVKVLLPARLPATLKAPAP